MMTFLPFENFDKSARALDSQRLRKQLLECEGILNVLDKPNLPWGNHPITKKWRGFKPALVNYSLVIGAEIKQRGYKCDVVLPRIIANHSIDSETTLPPWIGVETNHSIFRGRLKCKGRADAVCERIRKKYKLQGINKWLAANGFSNKPNLSLVEIIKLEQIADSLSCPFLKNFYDDFGWSEDYLDNYKELLK